MDAQKKGSGVESQAKFSGSPRSCQQRDRRSFVSSVERFEAAKQRSLDVANSIGELVENQEFLESTGLNPEDLLLRRLKIDNCSTYLQVRDYYEHDQYRIRSSRCRQSYLCQSCAIVRGSRTMSSMLEKVEAVQAAGKKRYFYLLTVTVVDGDDLKERVNHLLDNWRNMLVDRRVRKGKKGNSLTRLDGGLYSVEVKRGKNSGQWHPHIHALVSCSEPLSVEKDQNGKYRWLEFSQQWKEKTGDSFIVECHPVYEVVDGNTDFVTTDSSAESLLGALAEVCKYALKFSSMSVEDQLRAWSILRGRRLVQGFGEFYNVKVNEVDDAEFLDSVWPYVEYMYGWKRGQYQIKEWSVRPCGENGVKANGGIVQSSRPGQVRAFTSGRKNAGTGEHVEHILRSEGASSVPSVSASAKSCEKTVGRAGVLDRSLIPPWPVGGGAAQVRQASLTRASDACRNLGRAQPNGGVRTGSRCAERLCSFGEPEP